MSGKNRYRKLSSAFAGRKEDKPQVFSGTLGITTNSENQVEVPGRPGFVWVQLRNQLNETIQAFNDGVSPVFGLPVLVEWDKDSPTRYKIRGRDTGRYTVWVTTNAAGDTVSDTSAYLPAHGSSHSFNKYTGVGGGDVAWIYSDQFMPWAVTPSGSAGSLSVSVQPSAYYYDQQFRWAGGTGIAGLDVLRPTGTSNARMILVYLDPDTGNPYLATGTLTEFANTITGTQQIMPYMPSLIEETDIPLAGIRLITGTNKILWQNLYDLRDYFAHSSTSGSSGGGGAPTDAQYVVMALNGDLSAERVLTAGSDVTLTDGGAGGNATVGVATGTFSRAGHGHLYPYSVAIYEDDAFVATGTIIDFGTNVNVAVTGSVVYVSTVDTGGGGSGDLLIYDNDVFQVTGTALDFGDYLNVVVTGSVAYISSPFSPTGFDIGARVYNSTDQNITGSIWQVLLFDSEDYDTDGIHSTVTNTDRLTCQTAGKYLITFNGRFDPNATGDRQFQIRYYDGVDKPLTHTITPGHASFLAGFSNSAILDMSVGDYVYARVFQDSGGGLNIDSTDGTSPYFSMHKIDGGGNAIQVYDDGVWKATGTSIDFGDNLDVSVTGNSVWVDGQAGGGGADLLIYDNGAFKVTGTALDFGDYLNVSVTGSVAYIAGQAGGGVGSTSGYIGTELRNFTVGSGGTGTISIENIPSGYDYIKIFLYGRSEYTGANNDYLLLSFNSDTTDSNYYRERHRAGIDHTETASADRIAAYLANETSTNTQSVGQIEITIVGYDSNSFHKTYHAHSQHRYEETTEINLYDTVGFWENTGSISQIDLTTNSGSDFSAGTQLVAVGYKQQNINANSAIQVYDDSVFVATGTAISFDAGLDVVSTGTTAYVGLQDIGARVYNSTGTTISTEVWTSIPLDTEVYDTDGMHSGSSSQIYINTSGKYSIFGSVAFAPSVAGDYRFIRIFMNGTTPITYSSAFPLASLVEAIQSISTVRNLNAGDYIELQCLQNTGGDLGITYYDEFSPILAVQMIA